MATAGPVETAFNLPGLSPARRAKIALGRLRDRDVKPERLLAIVMAVHMLEAEAPEAVHRTREYRQVACAKAAWRLASGTHKRWTLPLPNGQTKVTELHHWPESRGLVLRRLGAALEAEAELVIDKHLAEALALKVERHGPHPVRLAYPQAAARG